MQDLSDWADDVFCDHDKLPFKEITWVGPPIFTFQGGVHILNKKAKN